MSVMVDKWKLLIVVVNAVEEVKERKKTIFIFIKWTALIFPLLL